MYKRQVQNYTRTLYGAQGQLPAPQGAELTQMDYEFYPQALENVIRKVAADFKGDLIVTENGIATADDTRRVAFIEAALAGVQNCIADAVSYTHLSNVLPYCYFPCQIPSVYMAQQQ